MMETLEALEMMKNKEWSSLYVKYCHIKIYDVNTSKGHVDQWLFTVLYIPYTCEHAHTHTQITGSYVNLPMNNHTRRSYDLLPVHCPVKKQHTVWFLWYLFWPEISLAKIMHGNMPCHDAKFIYLYTVSPFFFKVLAYTF